MKNLILTLTLSLISLIAFSQNKIQLFQNIDYQSNDLREKSFVKNALIADLNINNIAFLKQKNPSMWELALPLSESRKNHGFLMTKFDFISQDLEVIGSESGKISYGKGSHYIATSEDGDGNGVFSIYDESIIGIIGFKNGDNYNIGEMKNSSGKYIIYRDADLKRDLKIYCDTQEEPLTEDDIRDLKNFSRGEEDKCIDIYIEADYALYSENGKNITKTINYILGLFAETAFLYRNEGISIKVSRIKIWETPDSYNTNSSHKALGEFGDNNPDSDTDLNLLLALGGKGLGGVAYLNALCNEGIHFAYANIDSIYNNIPTYSWSVMVITHELGHNLGSGHTHGCRWSDNNTQIDDCGNVYFYNNGDTPEGVSCFDPENPLIPTDGGTIMSYCHLVGAAGINLSKGFGEQPGNLIRKRVSQAECVDSCQSYGDTIPIAAFTSKTLTCVEGEIKFTDLSVNLPNEWIWIFENISGNDTTYHKSPVMKYLNQGVFDVTLIAKNGAGSDTITKIELVKVLPGPKAGFTYEMLDKQNVQFKNISEDANKYFWRFGDGNVSFQKAPKYKYNKAGKFVVELRATKDTCNTHAFFTDTIEIKIPYKASIIFDKTNICQGDSVLFKTPDLPYDSLKWYFTGGNIGYSTKDKLYVTYDQGGVFDVLLITYSKYGSDTLEKINLINVYKFPEILFDFSVTTDTVSFFNDSKDASSFVWNFGDSTTSTQKNPTHIYNENGKYIVTLTGKNSCYSSEMMKEVIINKVSVVNNEKIEFVIFPNPGSGLFKFSYNLNDSKLKWLKVNDMNGACVFHINQPDTYLNESMELDLRNLVNGVYNIELNVDNNILNTKLIIVK